MPSPSAFEPGDLLAEPDVEAPPTQVLFEESGHFPVEHGRQQLVKHLDDGDVDPARDERFGSLQPN